MTLPQELILSVSGIRGRVGQELTPELVTRLAAAFGTFVKRRGWGLDMALARDSRPSGAAFARAAASGLQAVGCRVSDLGLVPTPTALLAIEERGLSGGIVVTASHNPKEWNALKLAGPDGAFLAPADGAEFMESLRGDGPADYAAWDGYGAVHDVTDAVTRHLARILELPIVDRDAIAARGFRVVVDCVRGAGAMIMLPLLRELGCDVVGIETEADGRFTREPEPVPENLERLCEAVRREDAQLGMAVDPDVDRLALVSEDGVAIGEDYTLALAARIVLSHDRGPVVANLSTSQVVADVCEAAGVAFHRAPVGEANVASVMKEVGAVVGGEGNGGVMLPSLHLTRDAPVAAALIVQLLAAVGKPLSELVAEYPRYRTLKERFPRPQVELEGIYGEIERCLAAAGPEAGGARVDRRDGLHLSWPELRTWLHVRPSGTEPVVRVVAESKASDEAGLRRRLDEVGRILAGMGGGERER